MNHTNKFKMPAYLSAILMIGMSIPQNSSTVLAAVNPAIAFQAVIMSVPGDVVKPEEAKKAVENAKAETKTPGAKETEVKVEAKGAKSEKTTPAPIISKEALDKLSARVSAKERTVTLDSEVAQVLKFVPNDDKNKKEIVTKQISFKLNESPEEPVYFGVVLDSENFIFGSNKLKSENKMYTYRFSRNAELLAASVASNGTVTELKGDEAKEGFKAVATIWSKAAESLPAPKPAAPAVAIVASAPAKESSEQRPQ